MTGLNINHLPPEMIGEIMQRLDVRSMKNATLTCKLWNNVIEATCRWPLLLTDREHGVQEKANFILTTKRKIGTIEVRWCDLVERTEAYKIFRKHGANVVKLVLLGGYMDSVGALADLLNLMPNLEHALVTIGPRPAKRKLPLRYILPDMRKLKKLEWSVCDQRFITCFRNAKLTKMIIREIHAVSHFGSLVGFLSSQDTLTSLTVKSVWSPHSILDEMGKMNAPITFRLTKLSINVLGLQPSSNHDNLLKFIKSQTENLTQMEIGANTSTTVYEPVFALTKLNTLIVSICQLPQDKNFYAQFEKNHSVRTIELRDRSSGDLRFLCNFFEIFPNIRSLILRDTLGDMNSKILVMAQSLQKLESLSIGAIDRSSFGRLKFCNLKALHICYLAGKIDWDQFTKNNSRLTELTIEMIYESMFTNDDVDQMATNVDLQSISLGLGFIVDDQFFDIIREKCVNLRKLYLRSLCMGNYT